MGFDIGDEVFHRRLKRKAKVNDLINDTTIEVEYDKTFYYWFVDEVDNLELVAGFSEGAILGSNDPFWWEDDVTLKFDTPPPVPKCSCQSRDLFHYGCKCGQFERERK